MLPQQLGKLKLPKDDTRYYTMLHTLTHPLPLHSTGLYAGHIYTPGTASNSIPAVAARHQQDEASPPVSLTPSPSAHLHEGFPESYNH